MVEGNTYRKLDPVFVVKGGDGNAPDLIDPPPSRTTTPSPAVAAVDADGPEVTASTEAPPAAGLRPSNGSSQLITMSGTPINWNSTEHTSALVPTLPSPEKATVLVVGADKGRFATSTDSNAPVSGNLSSRTSHDASSSLRSRSSPRRNSSGSNSSNSNGVVDNNFWVCRRCTLQNMLGRTVCAACASRAPPRRSISPSSSKPSPAKRLRTNSSWEL